MLALIRSGTAGAKPVEEGKTERERKRDNGQWPGAAAFVGFRAASPHLGKCPANRINQPRTLRSAGSSAKTSANFYILSAGRPASKEDRFDRSLTGKSDRRDYIFSSSQSCPPRRSRLVFVRQLRQIFCVLIKHGLRPTVPLCRSRSRPRSGRVWTCICIQRTGFAAITLLLPKDLPVGVARCPSPNSSTEHATHRARHNINVFTLRSIFAP